MAVHTNNKIILPAPGFNLAATLFSGQSFTWQQTGPGVYTGVAGIHAANAQYIDGSIVLIPLAGGNPGQATAFWANYFDMDTDYAALETRFSRHKKLAECVQASCGIRVLRQPFFDTLISFIISQNNNIKRITGIVQRLAQGFGAPLGNGLYAFPTPQALATLLPEDLADIRAGFRAKYILDAARRVASGEIDEARLRALPTNEAREALMAIVGVGRKVADCVLLYTLSRTEVVPMDVWMKRAMEQTFPKGMPSCASGYEGIAQQYIFCWARENL